MTSILARGFPIMYVAIIGATVAAIVVIAVFLFMRHHDKK